MALLLGVAVAVVFLRAGAVDPNGPDGELARANPGLEITVTGGGHLRVSSRDGADQVYMRKTDAGPFGARLVSCDAVRTHLPAWFKLPDDARPTTCLEIAADDGPVQVLNFTTAIEIPDLWDKFYEPMVDAQHLDYVGGSASGRRENRKPPPSLSYSIDGPDGTDRAMSIDAFYQDDITLAVITLRRR